MEFVIIGNLFVCLVILLLMLKELRDMKNEIKNFGAEIHGLMFEDILLRNKLEMYEQLLNEPKKKEESK